MQLRAAEPPRKVHVSCFRLFIITLGLLACSVPTLAQVGDYEGRPVATVEVVLEGTPADASALAEFKSMLKVVAGTEYSAVDVRQSLHDLFASGRVASARVEIQDTQSGGGRLGPIRVQFVIQRQ